MSRDSILKKEMREAIAYGIPDRESTGHSSEQFVQLLNRALYYIEFLEKRIPEVERWFGDN